MALSANKVRRLREWQRIAQQVASGSTIYQGGFLALGGASASSPGRLVPFNDAAGLIPYGLSQGGGGSGTSQGQNSVVGDATADNMVSAALDGFVVEKTAITGLSAITQVGAYVYLTDDDTFTVTRPTVGGALVGEVCAYRATSEGDVFCYPVPVLRALVAGGAGRTLLSLGSFDWVSIANGDILTNFPAPYSGKIVKFFVVIDIALTGTSGTATLNMEIGTTDVGPTTPTTIVLSTAATPTKGQVVASAAITANNVFSEGDNLSIEAASVATTRTTGRFNFYALIERGPGL